MVGLFVSGAAGMGLGVGAIGLFGAGLCAITGVGVSVSGVGRGASAGEVAAALGAVVAATGAGGGVGDGVVASVRMGFDEFKMLLFVLGVMVGMVGAGAGIIGALLVGACGLTGAGVSVAAAACVL
jgi:hypothetical protein